MNNKEFTSELSRRLGYTLKDTSELVASLLSDMTRQLEEGNIISIQGFGTFEVKKKAERIEWMRIKRRLRWFQRNLLWRIRPSHF